jgi:putative membrane protein
MTREPELRQRAPLLLEPEAGAPAVIEAEWAPAALAPPPRPRGTLGWLAGGVGLLLGSWAALAGVTFVQDLFARSEVLGGLALAGFGTGLAMLGAAGLAESRAYRGLARVDRLRVLLGGPAELTVQRQAAQDWLTSLSDRVPEAAAARREIEGAADAVALLAVLRARVTAPLSLAAGRIGRQAALEGAALVAILPHPALDGVFAGLRGFRVIRQVAALYGLRPGTLMGLALARRVAWTAAGTAGVDMLAQTMLDQVISTAPGIRHLAGAIPGAGVAAVRLYRLATITAAACDPLPP